MSRLFEIDAQLRYELGEKLWQLRRKRRLKIVQVSKSTHIPADIIDRIECGRYFSYHDYHLLADLYKAKLILKLE